MTAATSLRPVSPVDGDHPRRYWELIEEKFLVEAGWDVDRQVLVIPWHHPWLGWRVCAVRSCDAPTFGTSSYCSSCLSAWKSSDLIEAEFTATHQRPRALRVQACSVAGCPRPWLSAVAALCRAHDGTRRRLRLSVEQFLRHELAQPLSDLGKCRVAACPRRADLQQRRVCLAHNTMLLRALRQNPELDVRRWFAQESAIVEYGDVSFAGLRPTVVAQVLYGLQARCAGSMSTRHSAIRALCDALRHADAATVESIEPPESRSAHHLWNGTLTALRRAFSSPASEQHNDIWDMAVFGHKGRLLFIDTEDRPQAGRGRPDGYGISQPWLRKAVQLWVLEDLPKRRGSGVTGVLQSFVNSMGRLSESLRLQRDDQGLVPSELGRSDIVHFLNRLAYLEGQGQLSARERASICRRIRKMLTNLRGLGLTHPGQLLADLPHDFEIRDDDIPYGRLPRSEPGRALPLEILRQLCAALHMLGGPNQENRVAIELMIDTGRRPDEICSLPWDCLERDKDGKYLLVYDNIKCQRRRRELPITDATAQLIINQQRVVRDRYPHTDLATLKLLPSPTRNPHGTQSFDDNSVSDRHRNWVRSLPPLMQRHGSELVEFPKHLINLYAYRHTYAQRHSDAGVPIDVLCELLDHESMDTTRIYYRIGAERRREAVDKVARHQFNRHGEHFWRDAEALLDAERARRAIGEVAVPYGICTEPTNVQAGGGSCPYRFRCVGCDHFRTDVSYLPDLKAYLHDLLRDRERVLAAVELEQWAKAEALPSHAEIRRLQDLIHRVEQHLDQLAPDERAEIDNATAVVRRARQVVNLGVPRIRPTNPDLRLERP